MGDKPNPTDRKDARERAKDAPRLACHICGDSGVTLYKMAKAKYACEAHRFLRI